MLKKVLIINNIGLLVIIFIIGYFLWSQTKKVTPIVAPASSNQNYPAFLLRKTALSDPSFGNSGDINISLKKIKDAIEVSWPKEYQIYSLVLKNLGQTEKINDNKIIFGFTSDKPQERLFPKAGSVVIERNKIEPPVTVNLSFDKMKDLLQKITMLPFEMTPRFEKGQRYSIEALFEKEGQGQIYVGLLEFTY